MTRAGARQNAYTTDDYTNYHITFAREDLEKMLEIEADRFQNLSYPVEAFKTESRAVLGEYNKNSANPIMKLYEVSREHRLHDPHVQAHDDGLHRGHRGHAEPVRVLEDLLRALVPAREHGGHRRRRRGPGAGPAAGREVLGRLGEGQLRQRGHPAGAGAAGPALRPRPLADPDRAVGAGRVPRAGLLGDRTATPSRSNCSWT